MKPRILIAMHYMELGGAESALLGLLLAHDPKRADIDLFLYDHRGELMQYIPDTVNLLPEIPAYTMLERPIVELLKKGYWGIAAGRMLAKQLAKRDAKNNKDQRDSSALYHFVAQCVKRFLPKINTGVEYDLAVSFMFPHQFVLEKVKARKRLAWIHTDYTRVYFSDEELKVWAEYDYIGAISPDVRISFLQKFPSLHTKTICIENILSGNFIRMRADEKEEGIDVMHQEKGVIKFLTIGRYCNAKRLYLIPEICSRLNHLLSKKEIVIKWYIIGYGDPFGEKQIKDNIREYHVEDYVSLLGKRSNPYPYIKKCDFYIQPSGYEGKSITVREAQILGKPVIVTNYPTASSQIIDAEDGFIVPLDVMGCTIGIMSVLSDKKTILFMIDNLKNNSFSNEHEIERLYKLID